MNKVHFNVEDLISDESAMRLEVLSHAVEISPLVTERTLGPDKGYPFYDDADSYLEESKIKEQPISPSKADEERIKSSSKHFKDKQPHNSSILIEKEILPANRSYQALDFDLINSSIILRETEIARKKNIRKQIVEKWEKQIASSNQSTLQQDRLNREREKWLAEKRQSDSHILYEAEKQAAETISENEKEIQALHKQTQRTLQIISFQGIAQYQSKFRSKYEKVAKLLMSIDKQALLACENYNLKLKELIQMFEKLIAKIKNAECGAMELTTAENLCKSLDQLEESILKELENIVLSAHKAQVDAEEQQRRTNQQQHQEQQHQQEQLQEQAHIQQQEQLQPQVQNLQQNEIATANQQPVTNYPNQEAASTTQGEPSATEEPLQHVSKERFAFYSFINTFYLEKVEKVKFLQSDENMKIYRFACQKAINIPVNAISAVSPQHLQDKFEKLYNFIAGQSLKTNDGQISVNDHPLGRDYCILLMAKKFVSQGDSTISSNPQAAFPLASVIVSLWKLVPEFGQIFLAYIFKESPFLVPYFIPHKRNQPLEEYYKTLGYRVANGQLEQQDMYLKRQAGIARLYAAVMITNGRRAEGAHHPYSVENAWRWLSNFVSLEPLPDICATLIMEILQFTGADMWSAFGKQFVKLLSVIQQQYFPKLSAVDEGGPKARLEILLGKFLKEGQIPQPQGMLTPGFW